MAVLDRLLSKEDAVMQACMLTTGQPSSGLGICRHIALSPGTRFWQNVTEVLETRAPAVRRGRMASEDAIIFACFRCGILPSVISLLQTPALLKTTQRSSTNSSDQEQPSRPSSVLEGQLSHPRAAQLCVDLSPWWPRLLVPLVTLVLVRAPLGSDAMMKRSSALLFDASEAYFSSIRTASELSRSLGGDSSTRSGGDTGSSIGSSKAAEVAALVETVCCELEALEAEGCAGSVPSLSCTTLLLFLTDACRLVGGGGLLPHPRALGCVAVMWKTTAAEDDRGSETAVCAQLAIRMGSSAVSASGVHQGVSQHGASLSSMFAGPARLIPNLLLGPGHDRLGADASAELLRLLLAGLAPWQLDESATELSAFYVSELAVDEEAAAAFEGRAGAVAAAMIGATRRYPCNLSIAASFIRCCAALWTSCPSAAAALYQLGGLPALAGCLQALNREAACILQACQRFGTGCFGHQAAA